MSHRDQNKPVSLEGTGTAGQFARVLAWQSKGLSPVLGKGARAQGGCGWTPALWNFLKSGTVFLFPLLTLAL